MPYERQFWTDRLVNTDTGETIQEGTRFTARRMNHIEEGIQGLDGMVIRLENRILYLHAKITTGDRTAGNSGIFVDLFDGIQDAVIALDKTRTTIKSASGAKVAVASITGFAVGQEVTIASVTSQEERTIVDINPVTWIITLNAALTGSYTTNSIMARSTVEIDTAAKRMRRGSIDTYSVKIAVT